MDPNNKKYFVDSKKEKYWSPVDLYVGGAEHATRHLIYARFWHKVLFDLGFVSKKEPFTKLQPVGLIMGEDGRKMSKRFGNVVNPDDVIKQFGADTLRLYEMFMGPFEQQISWSTSSIVGSRRFIERIWKLSAKISKNVDEKSLKSVNVIIHKTIKKVGDDIVNLRFNTAISALMIAVNDIEKMENITKEQFETVLKMIAPFAPHVAEELWSSLENKKSIHISSWPVFDPKMIVEDQMTLAIQVNGKMRASILVDAEISETELKTKVFELIEVKKWTDGKEIKKVIVVKGKLVSIVTN